MNSRGARLALIVIGAIALVIGAVWIGQGSNLIPGSFMTGNGMWLVVGVVVAVVGLVLLVLGVRGTTRRRSRS